MVSALRNSKLLKDTRSGLWLLAGVVTLTGCTNPFGQEGYLRDRSGDYTEARVTEPVKLPKGGDSVLLGDILVIPDISQPHEDLGKEFDVPRPSQRLMLKEGENYSLERSGTQEWLAVDKAPAEVWPGVVGYVNSLGVNVVIKNPVKGTVETGWTDFNNAENQGVLYRTLGKLFGADHAGSMEDRFRFELKSGIKPGSSEVYVYHQGRPLSEKDKENVPSQWDNQDERSQKLDNEVLAELLIYLAKAEVNSSVSLQAQSIDLSSQAEITQDGNGNPVLTIRGVSFARVWDSVGSALDKAGLSVLDRNRSAGLFYLSEDLTTKKQLEEEKGFWSTLFGSDEEESENQADENRLTLRVSNYAEVVQLSVEKNVNTSAPEDITLKLLNLVRDNF